MTQILNIRNKIVNIYRQIQFLLFFLFEHSNFEFVSYYEFRYSDLNTVAI
jgi:hypothetical protein